MLTVRTAADKAGVSAGLVYVWVEKGVLPHYRVGRPGSRGSIRIAEQDLEVFLNSLKRGKEPEAVLPPPAPRQKIVLKHLRLRNA